MGEEERRVVSGREERRIVARNANCGRRERWNKRRGTESERGAGFARTFPITFTVFDEQSLDIGCPRRKEMGIDSGNSCFDKLRGRVSQFARIPRLDGLAQEATLYSILFVNYK